MFVRLRIVISWVIADVMRANLVNLSNLLIECHPNAHYLDTSSFRDGVVASVHKVGIVGVGIPPAIECQCDFRSNVLQV